MRGQDLSPILASEVRLLGRMLGMDLPDWRIFFRPERGKKRKKDLRGLVVLKLRKAGINRSAIQETLTCPYSTIITWEQHARGNWDERWKAYYEEREYLISPNPIDRIDSLLAAVGRALLTAAQHDPIRFTQELGAMVERLASAKERRPSFFVHSGDKSVTTPDGGQFNGR
jgi:hypothetical protein